MKKKLTNFDLKEEIQKRFSETIKIKSVMTANVLEYFVKEILNIDNVEKCLCYYNDKSHTITIVGVDSENKPVGTKAGKTLKFKDIDTNFEARLLEQDDQMLVISK